MGALLALLVDSAYAALPMSRHSIWLAVLACCAMAIFVKRGPVQPVRVLNMPREVTLMTLDWTAAHGIRYVTKPAPVMYVDDTTAAVIRRGWLYRHQLIVSARRAFGLNAPVSLLAGQIHQESRWDAQAVSHAGAVGISQFMPATAAAMGVRYPELIPVARTDAIWSINAQTRHMRELWDSFASVGNTCERAAFALAAYNGGFKFLTRERAQARDRNVWFRSVELQRVRGLSAWQENRAYPRLILKRWEPMYRNAGYPQGIDLCI